MIKNIPGTASHRISAVLGIIADVFLVGLVVPASLVLKLARRLGLHRLRLCRAALIAIGVLPVRKHYYEPFIHPGDVSRPLDQERPLPGIDWNISGQLEILRQLQFEKELPDLLAPKQNSADFRLKNGSFESGDAEFLYQIIRLKKPRRLFEIGSGNSTKIARRAIRANAAEDDRYSCRHLCIEPFEAPWLEAEGIETLRERVENVDVALFLDLEADDLLFVDSSHVIRPQGDVLAEYLRILPSLKPGVTVHIHDIFSPRDYPKEWVIDRILLWNEQYLLEAFLTQNGSWQVIAALNLLRHRHFDELRRVCPYLTADREPGSIYLQRI